MALQDVNTFMTGRRRFVLVVDSEADGLAYATTILERFQYTVWKARTAAEALEMTTVVMPALVVVARQLEDMTGAALIRRLKENKGARDVSVIVLSPGPDRAADRDCLTAGAVTCLSSPVAAENLYRVVQMAIEPVPRMSMRIHTRLRASINNRKVECDDGGCVRALSENGAYVYTPDPYPLNTRLPLQLHLGDRTLSADAVVIYHLDRGPGAGNRPGMGLQFLQISDQDQQRLRTLIEEEITRGLD